MGTEAVERNARTETFSPRRLLGAFLAALPKGQELDEEVWKKRHRLIVSLLIVHSVGLAVVALVRGYDLAHSLLEASIPAAAAVAACSTRLSRTARSVMGTLGLLTTSALLVHFSGGVIEAHFHFFVMVAVVSLYQHWTPFLIAIGYVVLQHGTIGVLDPEAVYNHQAAILSPWKWAGIHGLFIAGESIACLVYWRLSEDAISGRLKAEERLIDSEARFRSAFRNTAAGMMLVDADSTILEVNDSMCKMLGYSEPELRGLTWQAITHPDDLLSNQEIRDRVAEGALEAGEVLKRYVRKNGEIVWAEISFSPVRDEAGVPLYYVTQVQDVTERRRSEEEKAVLEEQLRQSQKMDAVGRLAGGIAHDFNNLLAVILNFAGFLKDDLPSDDPRREDVEEIRKAGHRGARLIRQLLAFSRRDVAQPQIVDLNAVVTDMHKLFGRTLGEHIELEFQQEQDLAPVIVDGGHIEQVLLNLAVNARDAMPDGGKLVVRTGNVSTDEQLLHRHPGMAAGGYVRLSVSDTGCGIPLEIQSHIFEPFFTTKPRGEGSGLGLSTVYGIVKQSGGYVSVYSEPGFGTNFCIYLPAARALEEVGQKLMPREAAAGDGQTILLVEDEDSVRRLVTRMLVEHGYKVLSASCGEEALKMWELHAGPIHLVVSDVIMPKMSGKELLERIAQLDPGVKVVFMSGYTDEIIAQQGLLGEGVAFVQKPFEKEELLLKITEVLDPSIEPAAGVGSNTKVLVVDDEEPMLDVLRLMLSTRFHVVGRARDAEEALAIAKASSPDIIVLDYRLPGVGGDEVAPLLRSIVPGVKIVAFSAILSERPAWADEFLGKDQIGELGPLVSRVAEQVG